MEEAGLAICASECVRAFRGCGRSAAIGTSGTPAGIGMSVMGFATAKAGRGSAAAGEEGIAHGHAAPEEAVRQVLRQEKPAACLRGDGEHHGVPERQPVRGRDLHRLEQHRSGGLGHLEAVAPLDDRSARFRRGAAGLADEDDEELAERLHRHDDLVLRAGIEDRQRRGPALLAVHPLGVGKDVGVQRDPHAARSARVELIARPSPCLGRGLRGEALAERRARLRPRSCIRLRGHEHRDRPAVRCDDRFGTGLADLAQQAGEGAVCLGGGNGSAQEPKVVLSTTSGNGEAGNSEPHLPNPNLEPGSVPWR